MNENQKEDEYDGLKIIASIPAGLSAPPLRKPSMMDILMSRSDGAAVFHLPSAREVLRSDRTAEEKESLLRLLYDIYSRDAVAASCGETMAWDSYEDWRIKQIEAMRAG